VEALPTLPAAMAATTRRANEFERAAIDLAEALLLTDRIGEVFDAAVVEADQDGPAGVVALDDPAVRARCSGSGLIPGTRIRVRLAEADPATRKVRFTRA
jgi:exoribonuclease R